MEPVIIFTLRQHLREMLTGGNHQCLMPKHWKNIGLAETSLAHDLAPNMVKLLCMNLLRFSKKHDLKKTQCSFTKLVLFFKICFGHKHEKYN
jgi:hypothetical protein